jgi:putative beta-lysine N-acetyltransferase
MTDFATLPSQRGVGLAKHILAALEGDMAERGIHNLYTIARARSAGMNRVFYNRGYAWTGTLVNNCHIAGQFEDMHVWCKTLESTAGRAVHYSEDR